jgi:site-specific DNA-adenine methylase
MSTRTSGKRYIHEVTKDFHLELGETVKSAKCFVAISGYDSPTYDELFKGFYKSISPAKKSTVGKRLVKECLWTNYDPASINGALKFDFSFTSNGG